MDTIVDNLTIRNYQEGDYEAISSLWSLTGLGNPERGDTNEVIKKTLLSGGIFLVLELKSKEKGNIICGILSDNYFSFTSIKYKIILDELMLLVL